MPVIEVTKDVGTHSITIVAQFAATVERLWELYADPRQLEQVFGPPTYPATFVEHELTEGTTSKYFMTSPEGEKYPGLWRITSVDRPNGFTFKDFFATENFEPAKDLPASKCSYSFEPTAEGVRATYVSVFTSAEALQEVLDMGMEEGATSSINQIDAFLSA
ncbi:SRPBCC domain-containing protein [Kocuria sp. cx-455]|uniref:SRPBCC family protein n=1 Tax=Kocuria sp. cx-455 TaxID=2771377 RepID=UPI001685676F|nr:SRPBCC domain-containing protein [Kocuria sp. cx-455]MBD2764895.1 SRPBCC domain-containing protein [Kocuria sp. cx-455]